MRVSIELVERSLRIWDAVIKAAIARGFAVSVEVTRLRLTAHGHCVELRMSERIERVTGSAKGLSEIDIWLNRHIEHRSTGELRMYLDERKFADGAGRALELQLNLIFVAVYKAISAACATQAKREADRIRDETFQREAAARAANAAAIAAAQTAEREREGALELEAGAWQRAAVIRDYVQAVVTRTAVPMPAEVREWIEWATGVADRLDPLVRPEGR